MSRQARNKQVEELKAQVADLERQVSMMARQLGIRRRRKYPRGYFPVGEYPEYSPIYEKKETDDGHC